MAQFAHVFQQVLVDDRMELGKILLTARKAFIIIEETSFQALK